MLARRSAAQFPPKELDPSDPNIIVALLVGAVIGFGVGQAVIVLLDACDIRRLPRHLVTMAWVRNWPERWVARPWFDDYDLVFASSEPIAHLVRAESAKVASVLPIATNPARFADAEPREDLACDVLFVGSYWKEERDVVKALPALAERGIPVHVHGRGWDAVPEFAAIDRGYLDYDDVPSAYASARIVVDDAASSTKEYGSVNSRVFDALAAGAVVVSSGALGVHELFGPTFPTWSDAPSLIREVEKLLAEPEAAAERAHADASRVLAEHTYPIRAAAIRDELVRWASARRYGLRIGVPSWDVIERWGDYHFARALQRSLERAGHPTRVHFLPDWGSPVGAREDVAIHLFGLKEAPTRSGQVNLLWQISHPDLARASCTTATTMSSSRPTCSPTRWRAPAGPGPPLHQATDPERFRPDPSGPRHELLFVANSRHVRRRIVDDLAGTSHDLAVYGARWTPELIDPRFVKAEGIPNEDLAPLLQLGRDRPQRPLGRHARRGLPLEPPVRRPRLWRIRHLRRRRGHRRRVRRRGRRLPAARGARAPHRRLPGGPGAPTQGGRARPADRRWSATRSTSVRRRCAPPPTGSPTSVQTGFCRPRRAEAGPYSK